MSRHTRTLHVNIFHGQLANCWTRLSGIMRTFRRRNFEVFHLGIQRHLEEAGSTKASAWYAAPTAKLLLQSLRAGT